MYTLVIIISKLNTALDVNYISLRTKNTKKSSKLNYTNFITTVIKWNQVNVEMNKKSPRYFTLLAGCDKSDNIGLSSNVLANSVNKT